MRAQVRDRANLKATDVVDIAETDHIMFGIIEMAKILGITEMANTIEIPEMPEIPVAR